MNSKAKNTKSFQSNLNYWTHFPPTPPPPPCLPLYTFGKTRSSTYCMESGTQIILEILISMLMWTCVIDLQKKFGTNKGNGKSVLRSDPSVLAPRRRQIDNCLIHFILFFVITLLHYSSVLSSPAPGTAATRGFPR